MKCLFAIQVVLGTVYLVHGVETNTIHQIVLGPIIILLGILLFRKGKVTG